MGLSRQGAPRNCWALLGPSRRAKVLAEPGPEADLVAAHWASGIGLGHWALGFGERGVEIGRWALHWAL